MSDDAGRSLSPGTAFNTDIDDSKLISRLGLASNSFPSGAGSSLVPVQVAIHKPSHANLALPHLVHRFCFSTSLPREIALYQELAPIHTGA
jgi:hypothetical protein